MVHSEKRLTPRQGSCGPAHVQPREPGTTAGAGSDSRGLELAGAPAPTLGLDAVILAAAPMAWRPTARPARASAPGLVHAWGAAPGPARAARPGVCCAVRERAQRAGDRHPGFGWGTRSALQRRGGRCGGHHACLLRLRCLHQQRRGRRHAGDRGAGAGAVKQQPARLITGAQTSQEGAQESSPSGASRRELPARPPQTAGPRTRGADEPGAGPFRSWRS